MNARTPRPLHVLTGLALVLPVLGPSASLADPARGRAPEAPWIGQELRLPQPAPALAAAPETAQAEPAPGEPAPAAPAWSGTVELYGFAPLRTTATTTIRGQEAEVQQDLGQILEVLRFAASGRGSIEKNRVGLQADLWYTSLGDSAGRLVGPRQLFTSTADVGQTLGIYDVALRYRFGERESALGKPGTYSVIPYAGIRLIDGRLNLAATLDGPFGRTLLEPTRNFQRTWVQPLVGTQATVFLSPRLRAFARADVGGFGLGGQQDLSGNAQVGLGYAIGDNTDLNVSWRYMGLKWNNGDQQANGFSVNMNGIEVGVKFFFGGAPRGTAVANAPVPAPTPTAP
ncbi:hypothetical protein [Cyanobium gracile]|uniref:Outer membrane protein beta-barrel domain-containing protein n=1 Tax=Cyanobium gracile (strain ATCC 27147 / PCC 6307) TaxID=292564 RepID=K9P5Z7_CYAGP|nr:hypothetical protein [Cyanobium gracile]AFY28545.1 hypothetical protein Cyagr_1374 [Cyanobium gracile PCC 6307]